MWRLSQQSVARTEIQDAVPVTGILGDQHTGHGEWGSYGAPWVLIGEVTYAHTSPCEQPCPPQCEYFLVWASSVPDFLMNLHIDIG